MLITDSKQATRLEILKFIIENLDSFNDIYYADNIIETADMMTNFVLYGKREKETNAEKE